MNLQSIRFSFAFFICPSSCFIISPLEFFNGYPFFWWDFWGWSRTWHYCFIVTSSWGCPEKWWCHFFYFVISRKLLAIKVWNLHQTTRNIWFPINRLRAIWPKGYQRESLKKSHQNGDYLKTSNAKKLSSRRNRTLFIKWFSHRYALVCFGVNCAITPQMQLFSNKTSCNI